MATGLYMRMRCVVQAMIEACKQGNNAHVRDRLQLAHTAQDSKGMSSFSMHACGVTSPFISERRAVILRCGDVVSCDAKRVLSGERIHLQDNRI